MAKEISLTSLVTEVDANLPAATLIQDPEGNAFTFYKYKGTLAYREADFTDEKLAHKFKISVTRGYHLVLEMSEDDDISEFIKPGVIPPEAFDSNELKEKQSEVLEPYKEPGEFLVMEEAFRLVFYIRTLGVPACLEEYLSRGKLSVLKIV
mmetsp:Transcript_1839/g.2956  ORF Transcript_1839/g.2956 Transcript_1839/m.2956 type:complete len:151 (+) Transcript_1839:535-987(+)